MENQTKEKIVFKSVGVEKTVTSPEGEKRKVTILSDISFSVADGEIFVVLGPSGSGKSTLLRLLNRLDDPSSGEILLDGVSIKGMPVRNLRRRVGLVQQLPHIFEGSIMDNILYGPLLFGEDRAPLEKKALDLLDRLGFDGRIIESNPERLSVGEKQRICILRTLMNEPDLLLMDEPTSALDEKNVNRLLTLIEKINRERKTTIVMVTHAFSHGLSIGSKALGLVGGRILSTGPVDEVMEALRKQGIEEDEPGDDIDISDEGIKDV